MKYLCINSDGMEGILTKGRIYAGELSQHKLYLHIFRDDAKHQVFCSPDRFSVVKSDVDNILWGDPEVKINSYFITIEKVGAEH